MSRTPFPLLSRRRFGRGLGVLLLGAAARGRGASAGPTEPVRLLNVSFDISRELFQEINPAFAAEWKRRTGGVVTIQQSHGGSSKQARSVIDGLAADVVTFNQSLDIDVLATRGGLVPADWRTRLPHQSAPFTSPVVFLVRKGNPKGLRDWTDLVKPGVSVIVPNPKTSGNGRSSYLTAWAHALKKQNLSPAESREFVARLFRNAPVLDTGGRAATGTFAQRGIGDVLLTFEAEARMTLEELGSERLELVRPSLSLEADLPVAVVEKVARKRGTEAVARAYLEFLYTETGQEIAARHHFRPRLEAVARRHADRFGALEVFTVDDVFGGWPAAHQEHFADGGVFDQLSRPAR